ncbi:MAG TPA: hypothetical protein VJ840_01205 [Gemmatimonadaceae bacterium]|nr:hypothetical protein [Gemmatimonadaceae bacterium]
MNDRKSDSHAFSDLETSHPVVTDSNGDAPETEPLAVRLGDLWSDFIRVADEARDPDAPKNSRVAVPILDEMKGILQWD